MPKIFISYRRAHTQPTAGRIADRLKSVFGRENVFIDIDIKPGRNWQRELRRAINRCSHLLVLIDSNWLNAFKDTPQDWVVSEVKAGLQRGDRRCRVIPVLLNGATMPEHIPEEITDLGNCQACSLETGERFDRDMTALIAHLSNNHSQPVNQTPVTPPSSPDPFPNLIALILILALVIVMAIVAIVAISGLGATLNSGF